MRRYFLIGMMAISGVALLCVDFAPISVDRTMAASGVQAHGLYRKIHRDLGTGIKVNSTGWLRPCFLGYIDILAERQFLVFSFPKTM